MNDLTLCRPSPLPECRKTCARYRLIESGRQSFQNFNDGMGLRCEKREDIKDYGMFRLMSWQAVDKQLKQAKETV